MHVAPGRLHVGVTGLRHDRDRVRARSGVVRDRRMPQIVIRPHLPVDTGRGERPARGARRSATLAAVRRRSAATGQIISGERRRRSQQRNLGARPAAIRAHGITRSRPIMSFPSRAVADAVRFACSAARATRGAGTASTEQASRATKIPPASGAPRWVWLRAAEGSSAGPCSASAR